MGDTKNNTQKPKLYKLAIASPLVVVLGFFIGLTLAGWLKSIKICAFIGLWIYILSLPIGIIIGIITDNKIRKSKGLLTGRFFSISGTILALIFIVQILIPHRHPRREYSCRVVCGLNLRQLGTTMQIYASDYGDRYPTAEKWSDLLIRHSKVEEKMFVCPYAEKGRCHYAINPNCEPNSPEDIVLLFETKVGWNQVGGPEMLTTDNHKGIGCNVLFNDGHVEFVKTERLVELKWETEKKDSESIE